MSVSKRVLRSMVFHRYIVGRRARRLYLTLLLLLVVLSCGLRVPTYLLTRKIQAVLSGLGRVRVDVTTEEQLLKTVPYMVRSEERRVGFHVERLYRVEISNDADGESMRRWMLWVPQRLYSLWPPRKTDPENTWDTLLFPHKVAHVLGWRHLSFAAVVRVVDGTVSSTYYDIEPDIFLGWPQSYFVVARSAHGFWRDRGGPVPVHSTDEERPEYRFGAIAGQFSRLTGTDSSIGVAYTPEAPAELISHVFHVDLNCFWSIRGCASVRQVTPLLWEYRRAIAAATAARLSSRNPCPDRILAERVRYLPDLNIALLEVANSREEGNNVDGTVETVIDYRLKEVIRGRADGPFSGIRPLALFPKHGDRLLYFSGAKFDSCQTVPATGPAEAAVRTAIPAPRRDEDDIGFWMFMRH